MRSLLNLVSLSSRTKIILELISKYNNVVHKFYLGSEWEIAVGRERLIQLPDPITAFTITVLSVTIHRGAE